jgi:hypothetical protein
MDGYLTPSIFMKNIVLGSHEISNERQLLVASAWSQRPCLATPGSNPVTAVFPCTVHGNKEKRLPVQKKVLLKLITNYIFYNINNMYHWGCLKEMSNNMDSNINSMSLFWHTIGAGLQTILLKEVCPILNAARSVIMLRK